MTALWTIEARHAGGDWTRQDGPDGEPCEHTREFAEQEAEALNILARSTPVEFRAVPLEKPPVECNADLGHPCDANNGDPCQRCAAEHEYWRREWEATPESVRRLDYMSQEELNQELRDAGRGRLVRK